MAYAEALARLLSSPTRPKFGLERMRELLTRIGEPQRRMGRVLHVAGTKGKGSTCAFAEAICRRTGLRTGLTTSPHLCTARERIAVDGAMIDEARFVALEERVFRACDAAPALEASFFERMIAMAFLCFAEDGVDVAVVEVGLGGRLDATNTVEPAACAVTRLGLDHTEWLGPTIADIAREKAGILKPGVPAVSPEQPAEARAVLVEAAAAAGAPLSFVDVDARLHPALLGAHQIENASVATALVKAAGIAVDDAVVAAAVAGTSWPGRYETVSTEPVVVVDGAHNADSARALGATIAADPRMKDGVVLAVGMTRGHDPEAFALALYETVPVIAGLVGIDFQSPRAQPASEVLRAFRAREHDIWERPALSVPLFRRALRRIAEDADAPIVVTGSLHLVGEVRHLLLKVPRDPAFPLF